MTSPGQKATMKWAARWYLWDGGFLALGRSSGLVPPHAHHAYQITIALERDVRFADAEGTWRHTAGAIVAPDRTHQFDGTGSLLTMLFVDPESREGRWLGHSIRAPITPIPPARLAPCVARLQAFWDDPLGAEETTMLVDEIVRALCVGPEPARSLDPRILQALEAIHETETTRVPLEDIAARVFLSPSRFLHLWSEHVGLPFRRYMLWRRLTRALVLVARGENLTGAALASGFADSAHLTRTCTQMFGVNPTQLIGQGEHYSIPAPFELAAR